MKKIVYILLILSLSMVNVAYGQKGKKKKKTKEKEKTEQVAEFSSADFPYMEKFHEAVRERMLGNNFEAKKLLNDCLKLRQNDDAVYFLLGEIAKDESNTDMALLNFKKARDIDPGNIVYTTELAYLYFERASFDEAQSLFEKMVETEPRNVDYIYGLIQVLIYNQKYEKAIVEIDRLGDIMGPIPELVSMKADLYLELKKPKKAEETWLQLKNEYPDDPEIIMEVIKFYDGQGENDKAYSVVEELIKADPNNGAAFLALAERYYNQQEYDKFLEIAPKIFNHEKIEMSYKLQIFDMYIEKANEESIYEVSELLYHQDSTNFSVVLEYGVTLEAKHKSKEALRVFRQGIKEEVEDVYNWFIVLEFEKSHRDYQALYEDAQYAITLFPTFSEFYAYAAFGAIKTELPDEATELIAMGEIYIMGDKEVTAEYSMIKGHIYFLAKDYKKGIIEFEKAISYAESLPKNRRKVASRMKLEYAIALAEAAIAPDIIKELIDGIPYSDREANYYIAKGLLSKNQNKLTEGISILEAGIEELFTGEAEVYDLLGDLYMLNNQREKAVEAWKKAQEKDSRNTVLPSKIKEVKYYAPLYY